MDPARATFRILTVLNALGCVALIAVIVAQWRRELALEQELVAVRAELAGAGHRAAGEAKRRASLENDLALLKEAITGTQAAAEEAARQLGAKTIEATALETELKAAREQVAAWETAIKERDGRIQDLTERLAATRLRLDEAVARLKAAAKQ